MVNPSTELLILLVIMTPSILRTSNERHNMHHPSMYLLPTRSVVVMLEDGRKLDIGLDKRQPKRLPKSVANIDSFLLEPTRAPHPTTRAPGPHLRRRMREMREMLVRVTRRTRGEGPRSVRRSSRRPSLHHLRDIGIMHGMSKANLGERIVGLSDGVDVGGDDDDPQRAG
jgi:hypothetical protein